MDLLVKYYYSENTVSKIKIYKTKGGSLTISRAYQEDTEIVDEVTVDTSVEDIIRRATKYGPANENYQIQLGMVYVELYYEAKMREELNDCRRLLGVEID